MTWTLPVRPWVLHSAPLLGDLTDRWIDLQVRTADRFDFRLLGLEVAEHEPPQPYWLPTRERLITWLAYKGMFKSGGLSMLWLAREFRDDPPAVVHAHYGPPAAQHRHLARALDAPLIASLYGYDATQDRYRTDCLWRARYARLFHDAAAFPVEGPAMGARLVGLGCQEEKVRVVRLPADADGLTRCPREVPDIFRVVIGGSFTEKKGFDVGIEAFARGLGDRNDVELVILGGGDLEPMLRGLVSELGIANLVRWTGLLPFQEFMSVMATGSVGLFPSRRARDGDSDGGAPVTLIETQWLGLPAIVSDHDDLPFVVPPDESIVLPARDIDRWADAIRNLYESPGEVASLGEAARTFVRAHHSPIANALAREAIYDEAIGSS